MVSKYELIKLKNFIFKIKGQKRNEKINNFFRKKGIKIGENCKIFSNIASLYKMASFVTKTLQLYDKL